MAAELEAKTCAPAAARASAWRLQPCGSPSVPTSATTTGSARLRPGGGQRGHERAGRIRVGAVAEDDVEQQHRGLVGVGQRLQRLEAQRRVDHRVRAAHGEGVVAEVDDDVTRGGQVRPEVEFRLQRDVRADAAEHRGGQQHRLVGQRAAGEQALQSRARNRGFGRSRARRPGRDVDAHVAQQRLDGGCQVGRLGREDGGTDRHREFGRGGLDGLLDRRRRRLGHQQHPLGGGVGVQGRERVEGGEPADLGLQVAAADAEHVRDADAGHVEQARDLLGAGAAGRHHPDRSRPDDVGEAERDAGDDRRAAVGAHHQDAGVVRRPLERHLVLDRDAVGEDEHAAAGGDGVGGLGDGVLAGHRDDRERRLGLELGQAAADGPLRDRVGRAGRPLALGEGRFDGGDGGGQRLVVLGADPDQQLIGGGALVRGQAHVGGELEVERRRHRDDHAGHARQRGHAAGDLHELHRVGVDAGPQGHRAGAGRCGRGSRGR